MLGSLVPSSSHNDIEFTPGKFSQLTDNEELGNYRQHIEIIQKKI